MTGALADRAFDADALLAELDGLTARVRLKHGKRRQLQRACGSLVAALGEREEATLQARWEGVEGELWPRWQRGEERLAPARQWTWGSAGVILTGAVRPGWVVLPRARLSQWIGWLPAEDPLAVEFGRIKDAIEQIEWAGAEPRRRAALLGLRVLLAGGHAHLEEIEESDLSAIPVRVAAGIDVLDGALCELGVLGRSAQRGAQRRMRGRRRTPAELSAGVPERFRAVHERYLEAYAARISDIYATTQHKHASLSRLWAYLEHHHPELGGPAEIRREHLVEFIPHAIAKAREVQRRGPGAGVSEDRLTAHQWLTNVRCFFADICTWAGEPGSPFAGLAPAAVPLERHDLRNVGFEKARRRQAKRQAATVFDLERAIGPIRSLALRRRQEASAAAKVETFWDWAVLELLVQSGLRIEEACELTTLDVLRRRHSDERLYYLLHVKPSKFDRARVIPIGDGLGRVIAQIIGEVKRFYGSEQVPACDHWDSREKRPLPRAPYLLQGAGHPSPIAFAAIRSRLARLSRLAEVRRSDGSPLVLRPHDCRRIFASEHLNNDTPIHVIAALLGHASPDTAMVYAKLYPRTLVESYRRAVRADYGEFHGAEALKAPSLQEWRSFSSACELRDMGTHLCALPTGEHCARGLICLGCGHAQPKKSAAPVFRRMLQSHERALGRARSGGEPAGQLASRELEVQRIAGAMRRSEELAEDVAAALEGAA